MALAKNKKLVLSVALNVLLAIALSVLLYFVYAQFVTDLDTVSNWGRYSVRTYRTDSGLGYFDVWVKPEGRLVYPYVPRRVYSRSGERAFYVEALGADLTGKGVPDLVVQQWYGSAHSDSQHLVLELDGRVVREVDAVDHLIGVECKDLNDDGVREVTGVDDAYDLSTHHRRRGSLWGKTYDPWAAIPCIPIARTLGFRRDPGVHFESLPVFGAGGYSGGVRVRCAAR